MPYALVIRATREPLWEVVAALGRGRYLLVCAARTPVAVLLPAGGSVSSPTSERQRELVEALCALGYEVEPWSFPCEALAS